MPASDVTLRLPVTPAAPRAARHGVVDGLALVGELAASVSVLVSEAVSNSVLHAGLDASDLVHVNAWWTDAGVHVEVCDQGGGLRSESPSGPRDGGYGLDLIDALASRWGADSNGVTRVWFDLAG